MRSAMLYIFDSISFLYKVSRNQDITNFVFCHSPNPTLVVVFCPLFSLGEKLMVLISVENDNPCGRYLVYRQIQVPHQIMYICYV